MGDLWAGAGAPPASPGGYLLHRLLLGATFGVSGSGSGHPFVDAIAGSAALGLFVRWD